MLCIKVMSGPVSHRENSPRSAAEWGKVGVRGFPFSPCRDLIHDLML